MTGKWERFKYWHAPMGHHVGGVDARVQKLLGGGRVLNIGAKRTGEPSWINMDISPHSAVVNLLGDAQWAPFRGERLDGVVMKFVLEHVSDPIRVVSEVHRVLKKGGYF